MRHKLARIILWLFVIDLGIAVGAGLYETRIVVPRWMGSAKSPGFNATAARAFNTGGRFWIYVTTVPLTLLTIASFVVLRWTDPQTRKWWTIAAYAALGDRVLTFVYFIPTMIHLMAGLEPNARAVAFQWSEFNWLRHGMSIAAWLAALQAFAIFARPRHRHSHPQLAIADRGSVVSEMELRRLRS